MKYPIVIEQGNENTAFGVIVPDLQGCFSASDESLDDAIEQAKQAAALWIEYAIDNGQTIPKPSSMDKICREYPNWILAVIDIPEELTDDTIERVNISLPRRILARIDNNAKARGETRSGYIAHLAVSDMFCV